MYANHPKEMKSTIILSQSLRKIEKTKIAFYKALKLLENTNMLKIDRVTYQEKNNSSRKIPTDVVHLNQSRIAFE